MRRFAIITNDVKDPDFEVTKQIASYLEEHGCVCVVMNTTQRDTKGKYHYTDASQVPESTECIIVLGGDGTLLQAARDVVGMNIPLLGINLGTLGYLAEIDRHMIIPAMDQLMADDCIIESRMMIRGTVYHKGKPIASDVALNDIVIGREGAFRVVNFKSYVNDMYLTSYKADGMIVSTPTGSTGYSLSCGGPIVSPPAALMLLTPIAPHTLNSRSIVLSNDDRICIEIGPGRDQTEEKGMVSFDGDTSIRLVTGDRIEITRADYNTRIVKIRNQSFLEILGRKMSPRG